MSTTIYASFFTLSFSKRLFLHVLQTQDHITALHNVCQQLDSSATGKAAETRLQKALDKLHKVQQSAVPNSTGQHVISSVRQTDAEAQPAELPVFGGKMGNSMRSAQLDVASGPASSHSKDGEDTIMADALMPDAVMADAVASDSAHPAAMSEQELVVPVKGKADEASVHNLELAAAAADKAKTAADRKAQKEDAKVCDSSKAAISKCARSCAVDVAWIKQFETRCCYGCNFRICRFAGLRNSVVVWYMLAGAQGSREREGQS